MDERIGRGCLTCHGEHGAHQYWCDEPRRQEERITRTLSGAVLCGPETSDWATFYERREATLRGFGAVRRKG